MTERHHEHQILLRSLKHACEGLADCEARLQTLEALPFDAGPNFRSRHARLERQRSTWRLVIMSLKSELDVVAPEWRDVEPCAVDFDPDR